MTVEREDKQRISDYRARDAASTPYDNTSDLVCLSHLRWQFVYQRPQHIMSRCARERRVFFVEEPEFCDDADTAFKSVMQPSGVCVVTPLLSPEAAAGDRTAALRRAMAEVFAWAGIRQFILWYYTPMARSFTQHLQPTLMVYDCMDELSLFRGASPVLKQHEAELLSVADVVFTGGVSLYEAKKDQHHNIHPMPSSIDVEHFARARAAPCEPEDQASIPHPRLGFAGVVDERLDLNLLNTLAHSRPEWNFVIIGPTAKIDPGSLPRYANIHYLGLKPYEELPLYLSGWDVGLMPFALNDSTRYISPTKTPEYLAAGRQVVSTPVADVVRPYGDLGLVYIASTPDEYAVAIESALRRADNPAQFESWLEDVDRFLAQTSWDRTWMRMMTLMETAARGHDLQDLEVV
jgi:glycosyltransferase involved in cell wall biosynthesis